MAYLIKKLKQYRGSVMVNGQRSDRLFPDDSKKSYREAVAWEKAEKERLQKLQRTGMDYVTLNDWAQDYLDYAQKMFVVKTYDEKRRAFKMLFKDISNEFGIELLNPKIAIKYLMLQSDLRSKNAANRDRKNLSAAWEWGKSYINGFPQNKPNPFKAVKKFPEKRSPRYVPPEEDFWKILTFSDGQDKIMLLTFLHSAARRKEVFNLTWDDVDFGNSQIRFWTNKRRDGTKEFDWLPMTSELRKTLMDWWQKRPIKDSPYVFVCLNTQTFCEPYFGKPFNERRHFMKRLCERSGVKPFGFHAIRHLTASILYHKGYDVSVIQSILRHKSPTTTNTYLRSLGLEKTREALEKGIQMPAEIIDFSERKIS